VFRQGYVERRKRKGKIQIWKCGRCKKRFMDPNAERIRPGKKPNLELKARALRLRQQGMTFQQIGEALKVSAGRARVVCTYAVNAEARIEQRVGVRFEVCINPRLVESLRSMFRASQNGKSVDDAQSLSSFVSELIEMQIADFRSKEKLVSAILPIAKTPTSYMRVHEVQNAN
jgi:hypothetical protein